MTSVDFSDVLKGFLPGLVYDLSIGHGDDLIEAPVLDEKDMDAKTRAEYEELISFWSGAKSLRKVDLFAAILGYCMDETLLTDITSCISAHYPKLTPKLDVNGLKNLFQKAVDQTVTNMAEEPIVVEPVETDKVIPPPPGAKIREVKRPVNAVPAKSSDKANSAEYKAFIESKRETEAMRNAIV